MFMESFGFYYNHYDLYDIYMIFMESLWFYLNQYDRDSIGRILMELDWFIWNQYDCYWITMYSWNIRDFYGTNKILMYHVEFNIILNNLMESIWFSMNQYDVYGIRRITSNL